MGGSGSIRFLERRNYSQMASYFSDSCDYDHDGTSSNDPYLKIHYGVWKRLCAEHAIEKINISVHSSEDDSWPESLIKKMSWGGDEADTKKDEHATKRRDLVHKETRIIAEEGNAWEWIFLSRI